MISAYFIHLFILLGILLILSLSLQIAVGFGGLLNFGHLAFYGIGAYASSLLVISGVPFWVAFLIAGILAFFAGVLLSLPTRRLKGDYLALTTLGFSFLIYAIFLNWISLTHGALGISGISRPSLFGFVFKTNFNFLIFTLIIVSISYIILKRISVSNFGLALQGMRDDELSIRILGKNSFKIKTITLGVSAFFAGIAGSLYAHYITFIDPSSFTLTQFIPIICIIIVGGIASFRGTLIATFLLFFIPESLRFIGFPASIIGPIRQIIYAVALLFILLYKPRGILGKIDLE